MKRTFVVDAESNPAWKTVIDGLSRFLLESAPMGRLAVVVSEPTRSIEQNKRMWAMLGDISKQVGWQRARWRDDRCIADGKYVLLSECPRAARLSSEEFKDVLSAALQRPRMLGGIDGGIVAVGLRTSTMTIRAMKELQDLMEAFGAQLGVTFSDFAPEPW